MLKKLSLAAAVLIACAASMAFAAPAKVADSAKGKVLVDSQGMTLYTFAKDSAGKSACNGQCLANWPAFTAQAAAKEADGYSVITRDDGSRQWAYKGQALYTWVKDSKPGDITGDGVGGNWNLAKP
ncbi:COG4315 family predicted lipoprotein [Pseudomonas sp. 14P_5.3_Bac1]|uniref:COG4315 family predicted lipoprotein n=1 Tax=Pseudomonas sp. 14P_5.3_Bac1 TaxID=2971622 RepID=UPI0021C7A997|nr:hypothetical protein [Pseudomonas sp. 14P_5.3_Bac1]MCU1776024.1 hypothetical protein [Pseudomonas sp. 14P_5.3_Bac1]